MGTDGGGITSIIRDMLGWVPEQMRAAIGSYAGFVMFMLVIASPFILIKVGKWLFAPTSRCWDLKEVAGGAVKLNACTGELVPVSPKDLKK